MFTPTVFDMTGALVVYVSNNGSDSNDGLTELTPKATLAAAKALFTNGVGGYMLLECGSSWQGFSQLLTGGADENHRFVVKSYGSGARPRIWNIDDGVGMIRFSGGGSPDSINHVAFVDIHFDGTATGDPEDNGGIGIDWRGDGDFDDTDLLIEGCLFERWKSAINLQGAITDGTSYLNDVQLRGCVIIDSYSASGSHSQGFYMTRVRGVVIEDTFVDHCGWDDSISGAEPTIFNHNVYLQPSVENVVFRRNASLRASSHGAQFRPGVSDLSYCLFYQNPINILLGSGGEPGGPDPTFTTTAAVLNVVIEDSRDITLPDFPRGHGIWSIWMGEEGVTPAGTITRTLIMRNVTGSSHVPLLIDGTQGNGNHGWDINGLVVYDWGGTAQFLGDADHITANQLRNSKIIKLTNDGNDIVNFSTAAAAGGMSSLNNNYWPGEAGVSRYQVGASDVAFAAFALAIGDTGSVESNPSFPDATRTLDTYAAAHGMTDVDGFIAAARANRIGSWNDAATGDAAAEWILNGYFPPESAPIIPRVNRIGGILTRDVS